MPLLHLAQHLPRLHLPARKWWCGARWACYPLYILKYARALEPYPTDPSARGVRR